MYHPIHPANSEFIIIRKRQYHVTRWGEPGRPILFMLHGWMDIGMSFQFVVDALKMDWQIVAPDWRGFGQSQWNQDSYWFPDYLADLEALLAYYQPEGKVHLVGHSMGGIIACIYAGLRPMRVASVVSIEGFGLPTTQPQQAVERLRHWLDEVAVPPTFNVHGKLAVFSERLRKNDPRLTEEKADFLAPHVAQMAAKGAKHRSDPQHKMTNPVLYRLEEAKAIWREIVAPVLWVKSTDPWLNNWLQENPEQFTERVACFRDFRMVEVAEAGHMLHHNQPARLATAIEEFLKQNQNTI